MEYLLKLRNFTKVTSSSTFMFLRFYNYNYRIYIITVISLSFFSTLVFLTGSINLILIIKKSQPWVEWLSGLSVTCEPKGLQFDSQSGHIPGFWARPPVGGV